MTHETFAISVIDWCWCSIQFSHKELGSFSPLPLPSIVLQAVHSNRNGS